MQLWTPTIVISLPPILITTWENFELIVLCHSTIQFSIRKRKKFIEPSSFAITVLDQPEADVLSFTRKENLSNNRCLMSNSDKRSASETCVLTEAAIRSPRFCQRVHLFPCHFPVPAETMSSISSARSREPLLDFIVEFQTMTHGIHRQTLRQRW